VPGTLILAGGGRGFPLDYDEPERGHESATSVERDHAKVSAELAAAGVCSDPSAIRSCQRSAAGSVISSKSPASHHSAYKSIRLNAAAPHYSSRTVH
jgi:hypothetical protein